MRGTAAAEVGYLLANRAGHEVEARFLAAMSDGSLTPVDLTADDYRRAGELVTQYRDLGLGTTNATVITLCERLALTEVATLDRRHFAVVRPRHVEALVLLPV